MNFLKKSIITQSEVPEWMLKPQPGKVYKVKRLNPVVDNNREDIHWYNDEFTAPDDGTNEHLSQRQPDFSADIPNGLGYSEPQPLFYDNRFQNRSQTDNLKKGGAMQTQRDLIVNEIIKYKPSFNDDWSLLRLELLKKFPKDEELIDSVLQSYNFFNYTRDGKEDALKETETVSDAIKAEASTDRDLSPEELYVLGASDEEIKKKAGSSLCCVCCGILADDVEIVSKSPFRLAHKKCAGQIVKKSFSIKEFFVGLFNKIKGFLGNLFNAYDKGSDLISKFERESSLDKASIEEDVKKYMDFLLQLKKAEEEYEKKIDDLARSFSVGSMTKYKNEATISVLKYLETLKSKQRRYSNGLFRLEERVKRSTFNSSNFRKLIYDLFKLDAEKTAAIKRLETECTSAQSTVNSLEILIEENNQPEIGTTTLDEE